MEIGLQLPWFPDETISETLKEVARAAEKTGFDSLWVMDHFFQIPHVGEVTEPMLEGYSTLAYFAGITRSIKLGTMVTGVIYRYPGVLVKTITTLDNLSNGRAYFGIGAAWFEREARGLGVPFPPLKERFELLEETLQVAKQMWSENNGPFHGKHLHFEETLCVPEPVQKPHPPILIGGMGENKTFRLIAKYADACNLFARVGTEALRQKLRILEKRCEEIGRPFETIEKTSLGSIQIGEGKMTLKEAEEYFRSQAMLGFDHAIVNMPNALDVEPIEVIGEEIVPAVKSF